MRALHPIDGAVDDFHTIPHVKLLASCLLVLVLGACVGRPPEDATGEEIYLQVCSNCHGDRLEGFVGPPLQTGSNAAMQPDAFLVLTITQGRGRMPSFRSTLNDDQLHRLVAYIREVQEG